MGYMQVMGHCFSCGILFGFNANKVPSYDGQPICEKCITQVNRTREAAGRELWPVAPDAYEPQEV